MSFLALLLSALQETETPPEAAAPSGGPNQLFLYAGIFLIIYFVALRPGMKEKKRREQLLSALQKGDKVMTTSGMLATIAAVQGDVITLQVADGVRLRFTRQAIQQVTRDEDEADDKKADKPDKADKADKKGE